MDYTQDDLNGILIADPTQTWPVTRAVGATNPDEMREAVSRAGVETVTEPLIDGERLRRLGADVPDGVAYLSDATARATLPADYFGLTVKGVAYPAPKSLPRTAVTFYTVDDVAAIKAALADLRAEAAARAEALRLARVERWRLTVEEGRTGVLLDADLVTFETVRDAARYDGGGAGNRVVPLRPLQPGAIPDPKRDGEFEPVTRHEDDARPVGGGRMAA